MKITGGQAEEAPLERSLRVMLPAWRPSRATKELEVGRAADEAARNERMAENFMIVLSLLNWYWRVLLLLFSEWLSCLRDKEQFVLAAADSTIYHNILLYVLLTSLTASSRLPNITWLFSLSSCSTSSTSIPETSPNLGSLPGRGGTTHTKKQAQYITRHHKTKTPHFQNTITSSSSKSYLTNFL